MANNELMVTIRYKSEHGELPPETTIVYTQPLTANQLPQLTATDYKFIGWVHINSHGHESSLSERMVLSKEWLIPIDGQTNQYYVNFTAKWVNDRKSPESGGGDSNLGIPIVSVTSSDGITYTAEVEGITELYAGLKLIIIPDRVSAQLTPTLNVNGLGDKNIIMPIDGVNGVISTNAAKLPTWLSAKHPMEIMYDGTLWRSEVRVQSAQYMYGTVPVEGGGTGGTTVEEALVNLGAAPSSHNHSASDITSGALPVEYGGTGVTTNNAIGLMAYPVGSIYMSVNTTSPATLFGGTWEQLKDRFLLGAGSTYTNGNTGGESTHTLTTDEMPSHSHGLPITTNGTISSDRYFKATANQGGTYYTPKTNSAGSGQPHNNMPPYLVVYMWKRTA